MVFGFKCFDKELRNRYGFKFEVGNTYSTLGDIKFGNFGNGYHMCKNIEDTLRYFDGMEDEVAICEVIGTGNIVIFSDEYNGYYDMYSVEKLEVVRLLTRGEIIDMALSFNEFRVSRFLMGYRLTSDELVMFRDKFNASKMVLDVISYYQYGDKDVYVRKYRK